MDRNLDRRVEAVVPVEDHESQERLREIIELMLADDRRSWQLTPEATWVRTEVLLGREGTIDTHEILKARALEQGAIASAPRRPGSGAGSLDPRA
jgi:polyphosphate kinase